MCVVGAACTKVLTISLLNSPRHCLTVVFRWNYYFRFIRIKPHHPREKRDKTGHGCSKRTPGWLLWASTLKKAKQNNDSTFGFWRGSGGHEPEKSLSRQLASFRWFLTLFMVRPHVPLFLHVIDQYGQEAHRQCFATVHYKVGLRQKIHPHCFSGGRQEVSLCMLSFPTVYFGFTAGVQNFNEL